MNEFLEILTFLTILNLLPAGISIIRYTNKGLFYESWNRRLSEGLNLFKQSIIAPIFALITFSLFLMWDSPTSLIRCFFREKNSNYSKLVELFYLSIVFAIFAIYYYKITPDHIIIRYFCVWRLYHHIITYSQLNFEYYMTTKPDKIASDERTYVFILISIIEMAFLNSILNNYSHIHNVIFNNMINFLKMETTGEYSNIFLIASFVLIVNVLTKIKNISE